ncbi:MAG TPA: glycosyltransferase family 4 protein [Candidatus Saccharimonadales bacterium]|nr:glycosyltransferase family 4 protein [Candidatus Saccharimonadales bacterium]
MKIFLPFEVKDIGGTSTFAKKFQAGIEKLGHEVFFEFREDYDVLFMIVQCPFKYLRHAKKAGRPIVQRLDGTYYWAVSGWRFPLMNAKAAIIRHFYTNFSIYQSRYSQECANRFLGEKRPDPSTIIFNGADLDIFSPTGPKKNLRDNPTQTIFFTASAFRRRDQIEPLLAACQKYRQFYSKNFKLVLAGNFVGELEGYEKKLARLPYVQLLGKVKNFDLAAYERGADAFLFTHLNPPCPNNIIEAMSCGLPIIGLTDGAMAEIVTSGQNGQLLPVHGTGFWRQRAFDVAAFAANMEAVRVNRLKLAEASRTIAQERFSLEKMTEAYVKAFRSLLK